ncbi:Ig-like domain-containing protein [Kosakonia sacchari]|uniref:Ig-like domain-containing protein n=1 Tax=Kosakonia sacchari TaxID=1158459 RepID=UPI002ACDE8E6|nr:Ig-like domain-containing protein [Kosakonia sacchari]MDZ7320060.1 Ig-like domain-containing protein [Kosakonia sacchari]
MKDHCRSDGKDFNYMIFSVKNNGCPVAGISLCFTTTGHAHLSQRKGVTDKNGNCIVILTNAINEDVGVKAILKEDDYYDFQYGIISFI